MEKLTIDTGIKEYSINGKGVLRFNPTDPGVYARFADFYGQLSEMVGQYEKDMKAAADVGGVEAEPGVEFAADARQLEVTRTVDRQIKEKLRYVFGDENDFDAIFEGVNILALTDTGATVVENLLDALLPVIEKSGEKRQELMRKKAATAVAGAKQNREQRRKMARG